MPDFEDVEWAAEEDAMDAAQPVIGVAVMQVLLGVAIATAPSTASTPDGGFRALLFSGAFTVLWLVSAACFRAAAKAEDKAARRVDS